MPLREKKKILELASIVSSLNETQIKNFTKIVDNATIQRLCCIIYSMCAKNRGTQIKKRLSSILLLEKTVSEEKKTIDTVLRVSGSIS